MFFDIVVQNGSYAGFAKNLRKSLAGSLKMLTFAALTSNIHLNLIAYEKEIKQKKQKIGENVWRCRTFNVPLPMSTRRERAKEPTTKLNKQLAEMEEARNRNASQSRKKLHTAEIYIDFSKLIFGGLVLGTLLEQKENWVLFSVLGSIWFISLLWIGNNYYNKGNKNISV